MGNKRYKKPPPADGQLRQSQLLTTYGPGALVDFPTKSVIMGGLEYWYYDRQKGPTTINEPRLSEWLARQNEVFRHMTFQEPPGEHEHSLEDNAYITAIEFPRWYVVQHHEHLARGGRRRRLVQGQELEKDKFLLDGKKQNVVPIRFVSACPHGHIGDINWRRFVHHNSDTACPGTLWMEERGTSGDLATTYITCSQCNSSRSLSTALDPKGFPLGACPGWRPWLGAHAKEECRTTEGQPVPARLLVRTASHAYFPQIISVISIPDQHDPVQEAVLHQWSNLETIESYGDLKAIARIPPLKTALQGLDLEAVYDAVERRREELATMGERDDDDGPGLKEEELNVLMSQPVENGEQPVMDDIFFARTVRPEHITPAAVMAHIDRVVLVHRLREVRALIGFTRFEPPSSDIDGELDLGVSRAELAKHTDWLPAVENNGEGIFIAMDMDAIEAWEARPEVQRRFDDLETAFNLWRAERASTQTMAFPGGRFVMLHTLSHLLLSAVALECGYAASSIKERIYNTEHACGILLYTGTPDSEGTLGGLVDVGRQLHRHLQTALNMGHLCSNDPVCSDHDPTNDLYKRLRHGAACHGCVLISETSCEHRNEYLDRALVVPTLTHANAAFFHNI